MAKSSGNGIPELVRRCLEGDERAWQDLVELLTPLILSVCRKMRLSREESLDVFGQVCYILLENLSSLNDTNKLVGYVSTITRREVLARERKTQLQERLSSEAASLDEGHGPKTPDTHFEELEQSQLLTKAMTRLSAKERKLIHALFLDPSQPTYQEIAKTLKIPLSSVGPTRARALGKLLRILKQLGYKFVVF